MGEPTKKATKEVEPTELTAAEIRDRELEIDELLAGLPELRPARSLRISHKNKLARIGLEVEKLPRDGKKPTDEQVNLLLDIVEMLDDFFESIAVNQAEYDAWAGGKDYDTYLALFERYMVESGE